ncbi:MAG: outer membrane lipoprotein carrier protein LolA, partial [Muribaculaceae bacterium]|nr:outer membrane lipoprotein carrier protein LolA [Muribaculaceae bacterium]
IVELTPKTNDMAISSAKITISKSTGWPTAMVIVFDGGNTSSVAIRSVKVGPALTKSQFKFDKASLPGVEVIDLR